MLEIRQAELADLDRMMPLWKELADLHAALDPRYALSDQAENAARKFLAANIQEPTWQFLVAIQDGIMVGFISGFVRENSPVMAQRCYGYIEDAVVTASCRRTGIGEQLCREMEAWLIAHGAEYVGLNAAATNPVSLAFWHKMGYSDISIKMRKEVR